MPFPPLMYPAPGGTQGYRCQRGGIVCGKGGSPDPHHVRDGGPPHVHLLVQEGARKLRRVACSVAVLTDPVSVPLCVPIYNI